MIPCGKEAQEMVNDSAVHSGTDGFNLDDAIRKVPDFPNLAFCSTTSRASSQIPTHFNTVSMQC
jgi:hypothetical protein